LIWRGRDQNSPPHAGFLKGSEMDRKSGLNLMNEKDVLQDFKITRRKLIETGKCKPDLFSKMVKEII